MEKTVYLYKISDSLNDTTADWPIPATLEYIEQTPQRSVISGSERVIDERLLDAEGRALFGRNSDVATLLSEFEKSGGVTYVPIHLNINSHRLSTLIKLRLLEHFPIIPGHSRN